MAYINPLWLEEDEHAEYIKNKADITRYDAAVDREIESVCGKRGVRIDEIPVDEISGYTTSRPLQQYGIAYFFYRLFAGYSGKRKGSGEDVYADKLEFWKEERLILRHELTNESITGLFKDNGDPKSAEATATSVAIG